MLSAEFLTDGNPQWYLFSRGLNHSDRAAGQRMR